MKRTEIAVLFGLILSIVLGSFSAFCADCENVSREVLRLHILANSDSKEDQALKLSVRDSILEHSPELFSTATTLSDAIADAEESLPEIKEIAENKIRESGYDYPVKVYITKMPFETRKYESVTMPAGEYSALRIEIGKAEGKNWWCVLFPALCIGAAQGGAELSNVLSESEYNTVTSPKFEAKFAIVEFLQNLKKSH